MDSIPADRTAVAAMRALPRPVVTRAPQLLDAVGTGVLRWALVAILLYFGAFKFTSVEAEAIRPLVMHSLFMGWLYGLLSVQGVSNLIGVAEITIGLLIATRGVAPRLSALGSLAAVLVFLSTLSFLLSTPGVWERAAGFPLPVPSLAGSFLLKDVFLLGAALVIAGESLRAAR